MPLWCTPPCCSGSRCRVALVHAAVPLRFALPCCFGARRRVAPVCAAMLFRFASQSLSETQSEPVPRAAARIWFPCRRPVRFVSSPAAERRAFFADEACTGVRPRGFGRTSFGCPRGRLFIIPSFPAGGKKRRGPCSPKMKKGGNCRIYTEIVVSNWKVVVKNSSFVLAFLVSLRYNRS